MNVILRSTLQLLSLSSALMLLATSSVTAQEEASPQEIEHKPINTQAMVDAHNKWRSEVGVPDVKWSDELAQSAQAWADELKGSCSHKHSMKEGVGENIFWASEDIAFHGDGTNKNHKPQDISEEHVVDSWGREKESYNYDANSCSGVCGHYTQVVWKDSTEVGCGKAFCSNHAQIWVCQYKKQGNYVGQKPY